jgi:hypothetical protein
VKKLFFPSSQSDGNQFNQNASLAAAEKLLMELEN